ncbi:MAG TPA: hypothetical protein VFL86_19290 [Burkholderiaceae bacterium]|nr:hypothetical protein [Burkholderiaceae bacterium]
MAEPWPSQLRPDRSRASVGAGDAPAGSAASAESSAARWLNQSWPETIYTEEELKEMQKNYEKIDERRKRPIGKSFWPTLGGGGGGGFGWGDAQLAGGMF